MLSRNFPRQGPKHFGKHEARGSSRRGQGRPRCAKGARVARCCRAMARSNPAKKDGGPSCLDCFRGGEGAGTAFSIGQAKLLNIEPSRGHGRLFSQPGYIKGKKHGGENGRRQIIESRKRSWGEFNVEEEEKRRAGKRM